VALSSLSLAGALRLRGGRRARRITHEAPMTDTQLTIEMLADSEATLLERCAYLEGVVRDLSVILADLAVDRAHYETLARGWIGECAQQRVSNQRLRDELARYTSSAAQVD
jgi:hypothetical protein